MNLFVGTLSIGLLLSLLSLGVLLTYRVLDTLDLTADGAFVIGAAVSVALLVHGRGPVGAIAAGVAAGALAGGATGLVRAYLGIETPLAGILTTTALYSVALFVMGGGNVALPADASVFAAAGRLLRVSDAEPLGVAMSSWTSLALLLLVGLLAALALQALLATDLGLAVRAAGDNPVMARAQGIDVDHAHTLGLVVANALVGLAGGLFAQYEGFADVQMSIGAFVTGLACVILGEALLAPRRVSTRLAAAVAGTIVYRLLVSLALRLGLDPSALRLATAVLVLLVLALRRGRRTVRMGHPRRPAPHTSPVEAALPEHG